MLVYVHTLNRVSLDDDAASNFQPCVIDFYQFLMVEPGIQYDQLCIVRNATLVSQLVKFQRNDFFRME